MKAEKNSSSEDSQIQEMNQNSQTEVCIYAKKWRTLERLNAKGLFCSYLNMLRDNGPFKFLKIIKFKNLGCGFITQVEKESMTTIEWRQRGGKWKYTPIRFF